MNKEIKAFDFDFEIKAEEGTRKVSGYGSVFNNTDSYGDIVMPGAFLRSLKDRQPAMLWQHRSDMIPGVWDVYEERGRGLYLEGTFAETPLGEEAYQLAKMKALKGLSIGYSTKKYEVDQATGTRKLLDVELWEVSLVTFPANEKANIMKVKSLDSLQFEELFEHKRKIEAALRDAGASDSVATYVASLIPQPAQRDAGGEGYQELSRLLGEITKQLTL